MEKKAGNAEAQVIFLSWLGQNKKNLSCLHVVKSSVKSVMISFWLYWFWWQSTGFWWFPQDLISQILVFSCLYLPCRLIYCDPLCSILIIWPLHTRPTYLTYQHEKYNFYDSVSKFLMFKILISSGVDFLGRWFSQTLISSSALLHSVSFWYLGDHMKCSQFSFSCLHCSCSRSGMKLLL